ncbi:hypothetical protein E3N88_29719 [Mikania micrantha]|uniref:Uncharacterized protein n=1 Tax=Mikania micrantha TaxID=192012 RepID=A0A5N6MK90_9ASTR|nr:hypothetical protein E3N88_29719 [Mikania micrantha]
MLSCGLSKEAWGVTILELQWSTETLSVEEENAVELLSNLINAMNFTQAQIVGVGIWEKKRNKIVFEAKKPSVEHLMGEIKALSFLWVRNRAKMESSSWNNLCSFDLSSLDQT